MRPLVLDIETDGDRLVCIGWKWAGKPAQASAVVEQEVRDALNDPNQVVITHTKYDLRWLALHGQPSSCQLHDTQVMAWLVNENLQSLSLEELAFRYLGRKMDKRLSGSGKFFTCDDGSKVPWSQAPWLQVAAYCVRDVEATADLYDSMLVLLKREDLKDYFLDTEAPFTRVLLDMELRGLPVDLDRTKVLADVYRASADQAASTLSVGMPSAFNIRSPQQVSKYLNSEKFKVKDRIPHDPDSALLNALTGIDSNPDWKQVPGGTFITEKEGRLWDHGYWVVQGIGPKGKYDVADVPVDRQTLTLHHPLAADPWVEHYLDWKKLDKFLGTYLDVFPERAVNGRLYARFNQTGTVTGRLSSSEPNLQNIPARGQMGQEVRDLFRGDLLVGDFAQLEPRLMAHFSGDPELTRIFTQGLDVYAETARLVGCDRQTAKVLILAMGYGAGANKLGDILAMNGIRVSHLQAQTLLMNTKAAYARYFQWRERTIEQAMKHGVVYTLDGRKRRIDTAHASWRGGGGRPERQAANAVIQGSAADVVRRTMLHTSKMFPDLHLLAQVHDELVWEYDPATYTPDLPRLEQWVESFAGVGLNVPLRFEPHTGLSWKEAKQ